MARRIGRPWTRPWTVFFLKRFGTAARVIFLSSGFIVLSLVVGPSVFGPVEAAAQSGSITLIAAPSNFDALDFLRVYRANEWSAPASFDLTDDVRVPPGAVVTGIVFTYGRSAGNFSMPERAVVDEAGHRALVNRLSGRTDAHNGKPVRQRWRFHFRTEAIWGGPATIWPTVTILYKY